MVVAWEIIGHPILADVVSAAESDDSPMRRLEPESRAKVMMAMVSLVAISLVLILIGWLFARAARHHLYRVTTSRPKNIPDDWANQPLREPDGDDPLKSDPGE